jgi:hypothetical protein
MCSVGSQNIKSGTPCLPKKSDRSSGILILYRLSFPFPEYSFLWLSTLLFYWKLTAVIVQSHSSYFNEF